MWKLVIADDERLIVRGLTRMVNYHSLGVEIVAEAHNGRELMHCLEMLEPDIVLTDITMPEKNGLEVQQWYVAQGGKAKFIFISGYQEFAYVQEALKNGAVDYLLKPVGQKELEEALKRAIQKLEEQTTVEMFKTEKDEFQKLFEDINNGRNYENEDLYRLFREEEIDFHDCFYVGICAGICPEIAARMSESSFGQFNLTRFSVFNQISAAFAGQKNGFVVKKDENALHIMGVFPKAEQDCFVEKYIEPIRQQTERQSGVEICMGIGTPADKPSGMLQSYKEGKFAFELYHFEEQKVIESGEIHREYNVSFEDYRDSVEQAFRSIIAKDTKVMDKIRTVMDNIEAIHYGNWNAIIMRTMNFAGDLGAKLNQYRLLDVDFYEMQNELQEQVESNYTMSSLKRCIEEHYEELLRRVYSKGRSQDKVLIEDVKQYITEHYTEELSIKELAEVACVSPNYFSAMFKKETGQNYKAYLTSIRMEEALRLLQETDYKTYEIGEKVGYNNVRRFVDAFKQIYSVSPMEYKKSLKNQ